MESMGLADEAPPAVRRATIPALIFVHILRFCSHRGICCTMFLVLAVRVRRTVTADTKSHSFVFSSRIETISLFSIFSLNTLASCHDVVVLCYLAHIRLTCA